MTAAAAGFDAAWSRLLPLGRDPATGGYRRYAWGAAELACRAWFLTEAEARGLEVETDRNGNLWAWWGRPGPGAFVTGSHLDSVPDGGAYDGPLGVVSALAAIDALRHRQGERQAEPGAPVAVVAFSDEEGARFGVSCVGSRLSTGVLDPDRARALRDSGGTTLAEAMSAAGQDPAGLGCDEQALARIGVFVELHVEQGVALSDLDAPLGLATAIWPHGRWRLTYDGEANHAGTTRLADRRDPMLTFAATVLSARAQAATAGGVATIGRVEVEPGATNAVAGRVHAWLDARAPDQRTLDGMVEAVLAAAGERATLDGTQLSAEAESVTPVVEFPAQVRERLARALSGVPGAGPLPALPTGAGHDAGILAARVPTAMIFVRNPTGVSHAPGEHAERADCLLGVEALAAAMADWTGA